MKVGKLNRGMGRMNLPLSLSEPPRKKRASLRRKLAGRGSCRAS